MVVDYAHTEDALVRLLTAAQALRTGVSLPSLDVVATGIAPSVPRWSLYHVQYIVTW